MPVTPPPSSMVSLSTVAHAIVRAVIDASLRDDGRPVEPQRGAGFGREPLDDARADESTHAGFLVPTPLPAG
jgi:hypothetical protein